MSEKYSLWYTICLWGQVCYSDSKSQESKMESILIKFKDSQLHSAKSLQLCLTLCNPMDCSLPGSSVYGLFQESTPEWVVISSSRVSSWPRDWTRISCVFCIADGFFAIWATEEAPYAKAFLLKKKKTLYLITGFPGSEISKEMKQNTIVIYEGYIFREEWCIRVNAYLAPQSGVQMRPVAPEGSESEIPAWTGTQKYIKVITDQQLSLVPRYNNLTINSLKKNHHQQTCVRHTNVQSMHFFLAILHSLQDLSSSTRHQTWVHSSESTEP